MAGAGAGLALRKLLTPWLARGVPAQLAAVALGGAGMMLVCFAAAWPLGLGEELRGRGGRGEKTQKRWTWGEESSIMIQIRWGDRPLGRKNGGWRLSDTGPDAKEDFL